MLAMINTTNQFIYYVIGVKRQFSHSKKHTH